MISFHPSLPGISARAPLLALVLALFGFGISIRADDTHAAAGSNPDPDKAWKEVEKALQPPLPPAEWQSSPPSPEQSEKFRVLMGGMAGVAADRARDFYTAFPNHPKAALARQKQFDMLQVAVQLGNTNRMAELEKMRGERLTDPSLPEDERFQLRQQAVQRAAMAKNAEGNDAVLAEYEKGVRELQKDFPKRDEVYEMLLTLARQSGDAKARELAREVADGAANDELKKVAEGLLKRQDMVGKPLELAFTAVDGRAVDLKAMAGKVVLVDFWATWCVPCVGEVPHVKAAYDKFHAKGFEIVGISLDGEKEALEKFVARQEMAWPQYFDGQGWGNKFARQFGIDSIPAMWLVDKKGNLRDPNARGDLETKVEKLLAE